MMTKMIMTKKDFVDRIVALAALYEKVKPRQVVEMYWIALQPYNHDGYLYRCFDKIVDLCEFMPMPKKMIDIIKGFTPLMPENKEPPLQLSDLERSARDQRDREAIDTIYFMLHDKNTKKQKLEKAKEMHKKYPGAGYDETIMFFEEEE